MTILNVWYEDLISDFLFNRLVSDLARAMGVRLRIRTDAFKPRQLLRAWLPPSSPVSASTRMKREEGSAGS